MIPRGNIPLQAAVISQAFASLFALAGGFRVYLLDASSVTVRCYLPAPTAGTRLLFVRADDATAGFQCEVRAKASATVNDDDDAVLYLYGVGDCLTLVPSDDLSTWLTPYCRGRLT